MIWPNVSCICITRNRQLFLRQALTYFERSAKIYPGESELVVVDATPGVTEVKPFRLKSDAFMRVLARPELVLQGGKARNRACEVASGDIIIHWDDDDWQHPERIRRQVEILTCMLGDGFTYTNRFYWYHIGQRWAAQSKTAEGGNTVGATFAYWKETWRKTPFREDVGMAEDISFQVDLRARNCPRLDAQDPHLLVYIRHNQNASLLTNYDRTEKDTRICRELMGSDVDLYDSIGELLLPLKGRESPWQP